MLSLNRRWMVFGSLGALVVGGGVVAVKGDPPAPGMAVLAPDELRVVRALCEVWFPPGVFAVDGLEAGVPEAVDEIALDIMEDISLAGFLYVLRVLEWSPLARWSRRFSELSVTERVVVLDRWSETEVAPRRAAIDAVKAVLGIAYFRHPQVVEAMGWRTGCGGGAA